MKMFDWLLPLKYRLNTRSQSKRRAKDRSASRVSVPIEICEERKLMTNGVATTIVAGMAADQSDGTQHPDIVVVATQVSDDRVDRGRAHIEFTVENRGDGSAENFGVTVFHSDDGRIGNDDDVQVGTTQIDFLAAGASRRVEMDVELDSGVLFDRSQRDASSPEIDEAFFDYLAPVVDIADTLYESNASGHQAAEANNVNDELYVGLDRFTSLPADIDRDGFVAPLDALHVIAAFGTSVTTDNSHLDIDSDGVVAPLDALAIINQIGTSSVTTADASLNVVEDTVLTGDLDDSLSAPAGSFWSLQSEPAHGTVNVGADGSFSLSPDTDFYGEDAFQVTCQLDGTSTGYTIKLDVRPMNDPPIVLAPPNVTSLTDASPTQTIDLRTVFADRDGETLTFNLASTRGNVLNASVNGNQLLLSSLSGKTGIATVIVEAIDAASETVTATFSVDIDRQKDEIDVIRYALASDQVIEFGGQNRLTLDTNFSDASLVAVR